MVSIRENELSIAVKLSQHIPEFTSPYKLHEYRARLQDQNHLILTAYLNKKPVGFKVGYALDSRIFYSWMGGVLPGSRKAGVAEALIKYQEHWCRNQGYVLIRVKTRLKHTAMSALLRKYRYTETSRQDHPEQNEIRIIFEKFIQEEK